jgi:outer membrane protein insertion porin family
LGKGHRLKIGASLGSQTQNFDVGFTEPYFLERNLSASVNLFNSTTEQNETIAFDQTRMGLGFGFGFAYNDKLRQRISYRLVSKEISNVDEDEASIFVQRQEGKAVTSAVGQSISYDVRDSRVEATEGFVIKLSNELAGFGGDNRFLKTELSGAVYYRIASDWVLRLGAETGYIFGIGKDVRIDDRFFVGGDGLTRKLRGFAVAGIGPRDEDTDDALGGNFYFTTSAELSIPIGNASSYQTVGFLFADAGTSMTLDETDQPALDTTEFPECLDPSPPAKCDGSRILEDNALRLAVGIGVGVKTPFGVIRLNYAVPLLKSDFDKLEAFSFRFGTSF